MKERKEKVNEEKKRKTKKGKIVHCQSGLVGTVASQWIRLPSFLPFFPFPFFVLFILFFCFCFFLGGGGQT